MNRYLNPVTRTISLVCGIVTFSVVTLICYACSVYRPYAWGMLAGGAAALLTLMILTLIIRHEYLKLSDAGSRVAGQIVCFVYATMHYEGTSRRAYVFLTPDRVHFYLWDKKPYLETTVDREGLTVTCADDCERLILHTEGEDDDLLLTGKELNELVHIMYENGYVLCMEGGEEGPPCV